MAFPDIRLFKVPFQAGSAMGGLLVWICAFRTPGKDPDRPQAAINVAVREREVLLSPGSPGVDECPGGFGWQHSHFCVGQRPTRSWDVCGFDC